MAKVTIGLHGQNLALRNPLIAGPGTVGYGRDVSKSLPLERLGAVTTNTTTLHHRSGIFQPRLAETPSGFILDNGLQNPGLRTVLHRYAITWGRMRSPVILSLAGEDAETLAYCAELANEVETITALQLEPDLLAGNVDMVQVVDTVRGVTSLPLIVHLPVAQPRTMADAMIDLAAVGCDAVVAGSPWPGLAVDAGGGKSLSGGVSGPAIRPLALRLVNDTLRLLGSDYLPLIAAGGISSARDVADFLAVGAAAVQLDAVIYRDPAAVAGMIEVVSSKQ